MALLTRRTNGTFKANTKEGKKFLLTAGQRREPRDSGCFSVNVDRMIVRLLLRRLVM
jgi:hypothetical protein